MIYNDVREVPLDIIFLEYLKKTIKISYFLGNYIRKKNVRIYLSETFSCNFNIIKDNKFNYVEPETSTIFILCPEYSDKDYEQRAHLMVVCHEIAHIVQYRLGIYDLVDFKDPKIVLFHEQQASRIGLEIYRRSFLKDFDEMFNWFYFGEGSLERLIKSNKEE
ncbi:MAG: hypothetical protein OEX08_01835 [Candidatus Nomurabacteria bacterium]|nr:hypothetical protein [Candidatus Nomurabacteria bacterium]